MRSALVLARKELLDLARNKVFLASILIQLVIVASIVGILRAYALYLERAPSIAERSLFKPVIYVGDDGKFLEILRRDLGRRSIIRLDDLDKARILVERKAASAVVYLDRDERILRMIVDPNSLGISQLEERVARALDDYNKYLLRSMGLDPSSYLDPVSLRIIKLGYRSDERPLSRPEVLEIIYSLIIPLVVSMPLFIAVNTTLDSMLGERENRSLEALLSSPITELELLIGKILPVSILSTIQAILWLLMIDIAGIPIENRFLIALIILILSLAFSSLGVFASAISQDIREANAILTLILVVLSIFMLAPVLPLLSGRSSLMDLLPTKAIVYASFNREAIPEVVPALLFSLTLAVVCSGIAYISIKRESYLRL